MGVLSNKALDIATEWTLGSPMLLHALLLLVPRLTPVKDEHLIANQEMQSDVFCFRTKTSANLSTAGSSKGMR